MEVSAVGRARTAIAGVFLVNGIVTGTWAAQIPLVEARLAISHSTLGVSLFAMALGGLIAMPLAGPTVARFGSALVTRVATTALLLTFLLPIVAPTPAALIPALFVFGATNGVMDVAMNAHGVSVERQLGRPTMSALHGMWSLGGLTGAGIAAALLPRMPAFAEAGATILGAGLLAAATFVFLLPNDADAARRRVDACLAEPGTLGLGVLCFLCMMSEGAVTDWGALHLKDDLRLDAGLAATGFAAYSASMAFSRFFGDRLRSRVGAIALVRRSAVLAAAGLVVALFVPVPLLAIGGFALIGLGLANLVPVFFGAAGHIPGEAAGTEHRRGRHDRLFGFPHRPARDRLRGGYRKPRACARTDRARLPHDRDLSGDRRA